MYAARSCQQHPCPEAHVAYCTAAGRASCPERRREDVMPFMRRDPVRRGGRAAVCVPLKTADPTTSRPRGCGFRVAAALGGADGGRRRQLRA